MVCKVVGGVVVCKELASFTVEASRPSVFVFFD